MATIRIMTPTDFDAIAEMARAATAAGLVGRPTWETPQDVANEVASVQPAAFVVAAGEADEVVGVAGFRLTPHGEAELYGPLVTTSGHGIGAWLASRVETLAEQQGATSYSMLIGVENRQGATWAEWRGYLRDAESPDVLLTWAYPGEIRSIPLGNHRVVRQAEERDLERVEQLGDDNFPVRRLSRDEWANHLHECWVLEEGSSVQALLHLSEAIGEIDHLCVDPSCRRHGLAGELMSTVLERYWRNHPVRVGLAVSLDSPSAAAFVRDMGCRGDIVVAKWMKR